MSALHEDFQHSGGRKRYAIPLLAVGAILLRLVLFLGRGDYVAFDEGWYLLLGRSLFSGEGYTLAGLQHTTLSPLFPLLAGAVWRIIGDPVWAGRIVAAVASGLLVIPCWHLFRRMTDDRTALLACAVVAALPSMAPFVVPFWVGWDLWVGAEPVLHLFLYSGLALTLRAREHGRVVDWLVAGAAFALAYLARPEAIIPFGCLGLFLGIEAMRRRSALHLRNAAVFGFAFALVASPYWLYLHDVLDRWTISGRVVEIAPVRSPGEGFSSGGGAAMTIERMLWGEDEAQYRSTLYGLDSSNVRLSSTYWGLPREPASESAPEIVSPEGVRAREPAVVDSAAAESAGGDSAAPAAGHRTDRTRRTSLYARALGLVVPWYVWLTAAVGLLAGGRRPGRRTELLVALPLLAASITIAVLVAVDPRTQLFIAPLIAFYAALGIGSLAQRAQDRAGAEGMRRGFLHASLAAAVLALLIGTSARRLYLSIGAGSPHHAAGESNRRIANLLHSITPEDARVMSWHPAIALFAEREWRVLPQAEFGRVVRYAGAAGAEYVVLSALYPGPRVADNLQYEHLVVRVPPAAAAAPQWILQLTGAQGRSFLGELQPATPGT